ncbi:MAG: glycosyltransferase family 2 protein [Chloroflexi bacterium]|nr:glycosyltransferase family 2 protein [Chloroflexota bacterium]
MTVEPGPSSVPEDFTPSSALTDEIPLSIVVLNYNTREPLRRCLNSIERSEGVPWLEVLVVDNASSDGSADMVAAEFPGANLIRSPRNGGYAYGNNLALTQARGRYVLLLNPDTEFGPSVLAEMLDYMDVNEDVAAAGPKVILPDGRLDLACRRGFPTPAVAFYRLFGLSRLFPKSPRFGRYNFTYLDPDEEADVDSVVGAFMLVRREVVEQIGLLDERFFMYGEDLDWAYRMKGHGWRIRYNPRVQVLHQKGASSRQASQRTTVAFYRSMHLFHAKHFRTRTLPPLNWLITGAIYLLMGWSLLRNALRPRHERRVST